MYHLKEFGNIVLYDSKIIVAVKSASSKVSNSKRLKSEILTARRKTQSCSNGSTAWDSSKTVKRKLHLEDYVWAISEHA